MNFLNQTFTKFNGVIERIGEVVAPVESPTHELHIAIRRHEWEKTLELLSANYFGGDALNQVGGVGGFSFTPLHAAAEADFVRCVEYLLDEGAAPARLHFRGDGARHRRGSPRG